MGNYKTRPFPVPRIRIFKMCPTDSDAGSLPENTPVGVNVGKYRLTYCRHEYIEFPTLENIERLWLQTLTKIKQIDFLYGSKLYLIYAPYKMAERQTKSWMWLFKIISVN